MGATEDQALTVHTRKNSKKKDKKQKKIKRDPSKVRCYTCDEKGHLGRDYPIQKRRHHVLPNMMNQQTKDSNKRRMIHMKSMC